VDPFPEATAPRTPTKTAPKELTVTHLPLDHHDLLALWDYHSSVEFPEPAPVDESESEAADPCYEIAYRED